MDGGAPAAVTVSTKLVLLVICPSLTCSVIVAVPDWFAAGVSVTVRFAPLPPKTIFPFRIKAGFEELPETVRLLAAVSVSLTVNGIGAVAEFAVTVWLPTLETFGAVFEFELPPPDSGSSTNTLNVGPVAGPVSNAAVGLATVSPVIGSCSGWPSKVPLKTGAAKKSCALRTSYCVPTGSTELTFTGTVLALFQLYTTIFARPL